MTMMVRQQLEHEYRLVNDVVYDSREENQEFMYILDLGVNSSHCISRKFTAYSAS